MIVSGDPLELGSFPNGFATDAVWFERTAGHRYPNAVANIYKSLFTPRVKHTADILISLNDGYYYGWSPFRTFRAPRCDSRQRASVQLKRFSDEHSPDFPAFVRADERRTCCVISIRSRSALICGSCQQHRWRSRRLELVKQFGDFVAVDHINLRVNRGSFFGFLGPNGAGKSTTIKMLTGLLAPTSGTLRVLDLDISDAAVGSEAAHRCCA